MTANIQTRLGVTEEREIIGKTFKYRGIWFFVHKNEFGNYIITEWSTGYAFYGTTNKARIKAAIDIVFDKKGADKINKEIKKKLKIYGTANAPIKEGVGEKI